MRGFLPLLLSSLLTRTATQMWTVGIVLFALERYHSPSIAGISIFVLIFPGLTVSPIAGALLDRHGRKRLMRLDFTVAAICLTTIVTLAATDHLPVWGLLLLLGFGSLTSTLSNAGARSLYPLIIPSDLWDRGNAADSTIFGIAAILGPGLAGTLIAVFGSEAALAGAAVAYAVGTVALQGVPEPARTGTMSERILTEAWRGLRYVVMNRTLRWIAIATSILNVGWGMVIVALPVVVLRLHGSAALVGILLAIEGGVGIPAALIAGRMRTEGRERQIMAATSVIMGLAILTLLVPSIAVIALGHRDRRRVRRAGEHLDVLAAPATHRPGVVRPRVRGVDEPQLRGRPDRICRLGNAARRLGHPHDRAVGGPRGRRGRAHARHDPPAAERAA